MPERAVKKSAGASESETAQRGERRREPRRAAADEVLFQFGDVPKKQVRAKLVDRSASGFRAAHQSPELACGQLVEFRLGSSAKRVARVVWTRISGERVETGFFILP